MKLLVVVISLFYVLLAQAFETADYSQKFALGLRRDAKLHEEFKRLKREAGHMFMASAEPLPKKVDLTPLVSPPEQQGGCGSCWDFAITKAARSAFMLIKHDPGRLAFNYLLNNCGPGTKEFGCGGGDFAAGDNFLRGAGPWLESQDPYHEQEGSCQNLLVAATAVSWNIVGDGSSPPNFQELAGAIHNRHMLAIDVAAGSGNWMNYRKGIYNGHGSGLDHMINMVGYDCESSVDEKGNCKFDAKGQPVKKDGYLIVENNWGTGWGEKGYMRTRFGANQVADTAMYFSVKAPAPKPVLDPEDPPSPIEPQEASMPGWALLSIFLVGVVFTGIGIIASLELKHGRKT